ncbi:transcription factor bHLH146 [Elaeis guineensis]|uniref:Transcription factor bHLH146 n=1 Tax=Elaeis guineensis var. tenera TaxID=51953 RepID=A0A6I9QQJ9_ELAGV|nr:transcription factor bHLH146 [Elaeis guineensis]XP_010913681.1 transcription factor bHLH146 [Elaeis guineensis]
MEEMQRSKRRRIYSLEPNATIYTGFPHKYVSHLLPALTKATSLISCGGNNDVDIEKMLRFEVDMALVLSATGFKWSRALKRKLEQRMNSNQLHQPPTGRSSIVRTTSKHQMLDHLLPPLPIPPPLVLTEETRPKRTIWQRRRSDDKQTRGEKEFTYRTRILRGILPGGNEMDLCELLSEVESYVVCLQLQVTILRSLVDTP